MPGMRRGLACALLVALGAVACWAAALPLPRETRDLTSHVRLAHQHLLRVAREDRPFVRYLSWQALANHKDLATWQRVVTWWLHQLSTGPDVVRPAEVPGSGGLLWSIDLRDYGWNAAAWRAVALREPYCREPWVLHDEAEALRELISEKGQEQNGTIHVLGLVRADWLFRESIESDRSPTYYDLLYARQRFELKKTNFPANEIDWNEFFGIKEVQAFLARQKIDVTRGAIVAGSRDDPARGSIVARNNRVVTILPTPYGVAMKTFDVAKTADGKDYIEFPGEVAVGKIPFDAGELLASLPNGGQAGLLINGQGIRTEVAPTTFAHNKADARFVDVRTMMGCVTCHAPDGGLIPPRDQFAEVLKDGIDLKVKDRVQRNKIRAFFLDWQEAVKGWQRPYLRLVERTTADRAGKALAAGLLVREFLAFRNWYDDPVTSRQAARELGLAEPELRLLASVSPKARLLQLTQGKAVPRDTFEANVFRELGLLLDASRHPEKRPVVPMKEGVPAVPRLPPIKRKAG